MRVLVLGGGGLLGSAFRAGLAEHEVVTAGRESLAITDLNRLRNTVRSADAELWINCAAHTDVDAAEIAPDGAFAVNALLPGLLAQECRRSGAVLLHLSSTGCYGDHLDRPYTEEDELQPTTVHHRSKLAGERAVVEAGCEAIIVRTGWLFGGLTGNPRNFVWRRLQDAVRTSSLISDAMQVGNPTWVDDVVRQCAILVESQIRGTYNCVSAGTASRFDYVSHIVAAAGLPCEVMPSSTPFVRAARISPNESAINYRLRLLGLDIMPDWRVAVSHYVDQLRQLPQWRDLAQGLA